MLLYFERELMWIAANVVFELERVIDSRQASLFRKFNVHYGTDNLNNVSFIHK